MDDTSLPSTQSKASRHAPEIPALPSHGTIQYSIGAKLYVRVNALESRSRCVQAPASAERAAHPDDALVKIVVGDGPIFRLDGDTVAKNMPGASKPVKKIQHKSRINCKMSG